MGGLSYHLVRLIGRSVCFKWWLKISGMYIFPVLQLSAVFLILIWMASWATSFLSWSVILKWEMLAQRWLLEMLCM